MGEISNNGQLSLIRNEILVIKYIEKASGVFITVRMPWHIRVFNDLLE